MDGVHGNGNRCGIAVEICYSKSGGTRFNKAEQLAAEFIAHKLKEKGWGIERVKKHQDFNGKYCPHRTLDLGWQRFLRMIEDAMQDKPLSDAYYKAFNSKSLVDGLKSIGVDASFSNRRKIAHANGISWYIGTAAQNTKMLNLARIGMLKKY